MTQAGIVTILSCTLDSLPSFTRWRKANWLCIILAMLMTSFAFKRLMAALLPISLIWMFVACVSICTRESSGGHSNNQISAPMEIKAASDCEGCPLTSFPTARITGRTIHGSDLQMTVAVPSLILSVSSLADGAFVSRQRQRASADPPLKRLPALRI